MNYISEINLFNNWLETADLPSNAIVVWYALMFAANRCGWKEEFSVPFSVLECRTKLNKSTICRMRRALAERGLISFREQGGRRSALYRMHSFESHKALQNATLTAPQTSVALHGATLGAATHKPNRTMKEINPVLLTIEEPWREVMRTWLEYKRSRGEGYSSENGIRKCLTMLRTLASDDPKTAAAIIDRSVANNWAGLFALQKPPAQGQHIGQIKLPKSAERERRLLEKFGPEVR